MPTIAFVAALALALLVALALAYFPMSLLLQQMARNVRQLIDRVRERRAIVRATPERRQKA